MIVQIFRRFKRLFFFVLVIAITQSSACLAIGLADRIKAFRTYFSILEVNADKSTVKILETIPTSRAATRFARTGFQTLATYKFDKNQRRLTLVSIEEADGFLDFRDQDPKFIDFQMPQGLEGHSLFLSHEKPIDEASRTSLKRHWKKFETAVLGTILFLQSKNYQNPIENLIAAQGDSLLPPSYRQTLLLGLSVSSQTGGDTHRLLYLYFPVYNTASRTFSVKGNLPELDVSVSGGFRFSKLNESPQLTIELERGTSQSEIATYDVGGEFLFDMNRVGSPRILYLKKLGATDTVDTAVLLRSSEGQPWVGVYPVLLSSSQLLSKDCVSILR